MRASPERSARCRFPAPLLGSLLERIDDLAELKCALRVISLLSEKRGYPRFLTLREIQADQILARALPDSSKDKSPDLIEKALGKAVKRGTLSFVVVGSGRKRQPVFGLNTESDRAALARLANQPPRDTPSRIRTRGIPGRTPKHIRNVRAEHWPAQPHHLRPTARGRSDVPRRLDSGRLRRSRIEQQAKLEVHLGYTRKMGTRRQRTWRIWKTS